MNSFKRKLPLAIVPFVLLLAACGQKGPLFLPGDPSQVQELPPAEQADDDESDDSPPEDDR